MGEACPISCEYLRTVASLYNFNSLLNEEYKPHLEDLLEEAEKAGSRRTRQHQRAFFCLELMARRLVAPKSSTLLVLFDKRQTTLTLEWGRSREGLNQLLKAVAEDVNDLASISMEYSLSTRDIARGVEQIAQGDRQRASVVYQLLLESATLLRRALKNSEVPLNSIGRNLALAATAARRAIPDTFTIARELLEQTETNAVRVWQTHVK